jgi:hypothetical protein
MQKTLGSYSSIKKKERQKWILDLGKMPALDLAK